MIQESGQPPEKEAEPERRRFRLDYRNVALILGCVALSVVGYLILTGPRGPIRIVEKQTYGVYATGGNKIGTMVSWVEGTESFDGVGCYVARYSLTIGNAAQAGRMLFEKGGRLRHAKIAVADDEGLKWTTEIGYSPALGVMRVIVEDNRVPENYHVHDNTVATPGEVMVPIHPWYLFRIENLYPGYQRSFFINALPMATTVVSAKISVTGEERVETPAGSFDCWALKGENAVNLWIAKGERLVVEAIEQVEGVSWTYVLETYT